MAKKRLTKTLLRGSARQRAILLTEHIARGRLFQERLLTEEEFTTLSDSFKTDREIKVYNEFRHLDSDVNTAIGNLEGLKVEVLLKKSNLRGYILYWFAMENTEHLTNRILRHIKDPQERADILEEALESIWYVFSETAPDEEGYLEIETFKNTTGDPAGSFWNVINNTKEEARVSMVRYLSWERAILDYMEEKDFKIKTFYKLLETKREQISQPIIGWDKYSGKVGGLSHPVLEEAIKPFKMELDIEELSVDEKEYNWYKKYFLEGADSYQDDLVGVVNPNLF